ncbi:RimK-like ATP-grasp domain-containing protein [Desulfonema limicola]|uniref:RimK-like ATP-grasp domain-containing protein n=1 Tax=Desulfonema limicola TaxID=45656 RepID=A0A975BC38_9BACT|nr:glutathione synthase [Desulfonema limicola]QTA82687.1 RimK-like ATP-grasp domain-containing protein [Desulfonema limicola]
MIVSFHPCFSGDKNILCAGREPDIDDMSVIRSASAVILPQGCKQSLYNMAKNNCPLVFPNYDAKFEYPDKIGQIMLFRKTGMPHPKTETYPVLEYYHKKYGQLITKPSVGFPFVFKFNWGGEGDNVFLIRSLGEFRNALQKAAEFEKTGQKGFLIQEYIPAQGRSLRVVIIANRIYTYWRVQKESDCFYSNIVKGGVIDKESSPELQEMGALSVKRFCKITGINLAGFDFLFSSRDNSVPLFLEINYFFGRRGLGGSNAYYKILKHEIEKWIISGLHKNGTICI